VLEGLAEVYADVARARDTDLASAKALLDNVKKLQAETGKSAAEYRALDALHSKAAKTVMKATVAYIEATQALKLQAQGLDKLTRSLRDAEAATMEMRDRQLEVAKRWEDLGKQTNSYIDALINVSREQARYNIELDMAARRLSVFGQGAQVTKDRLVQMRTELRLTREEFIKLAPAVREAFMGGASIEQFTQNARRLQNVLGHEMGLTAAGRQGAIMRGGGAAIVRGDQSEADFSRSMQLADTSVLGDIGDLRLAQKKGDQPLSRNQELTQNLARMTKALDDIKAGFGEGLMNITNMVAVGMIPIFIKGLVNALAFYRTAKLQARQIWGGQ